MKEVEDRSVILLDVGGGVRHTVQDNVLVLQRKHLDNSYTTHEYNSERRYSHNGAIMYI